MLGTILNELSEENIKDVSFYKLNVDENPDVAAKYSITSLPTVIVFQDGEIKNNGSIAESVGDF